MECVKLVKLAVHIPPSVIFLYWFQMNLSKKLIPFILLPNLSKKSRILEFDIQDHFSNLTTVIVKSFVFICPK